MPFQNEHCDKNFLLSKTLGKLIVSYDFEMAVNNGQWNHKKQNYCLTVFSSANGTPNYSIITTLLRKVNKTLLTTVIKLLLTSY